MFIQSLMAVCGRATIIVLPIIIIIHLWLIGVFTVFVSHPYLHSTPPTHRGSADLFTRIKWWSLIGLSLLASVLLFKLYCGYALLTLAVVIVPYCVLLFAHHFISRKQRELLWVFVPLLLSVAPIFLYQKLASHVLTLVLAVILYLITNLFYYLSTQKKYESNFRWLATLFLTINLLYLELISGLL